MKSRLALVAAVILGLVAAYGINAHLKKRDDELQKAFNPLTVLVAAKRIPKGALVTSDMIGRQTWAARSVTSQNLGERDLDNYVGLRVVREVDAGQPLQRSDFEEANLYPDRNPESIPKGDRAVTLKVDRVTGVAGNVRPGSLVDIFGTFEITPPPGQAKVAQPAVTQLRTMLVLGNVRVLATDNRTTQIQYEIASKRQGAMYSSVTVCVTPEEAQLLIYAQERGVLTLTLRNALDPLPVGPLVDVDNTNFFPRLEEAKKRHQAEAAEKP